MEEQKFKSYSLSKYTNYEIFLGSQIQTAGAHQARFLEKLEKNANYIRNMSMMMKVIYAFLFVFLPLFPLVTSLQLADYLNSGAYTIETILFTSSLLFGIFFTIVFMYLILLGMLPISSLMSGNAFKWLQTLPIPKKNLKKLGFMTIFRTLNIPLIVMAAAFPIIILTFTQNIFLFFLCIATSILNLIFSFSMLVIISERLSRIFYNPNRQSKKANLARILTMFSYMIIIMAAPLILTFGFRAIDDILITFATFEHSEVLNFILSLIPFPFASGYLMSLSTAPDQISIGLLFSTIIGFSLFILITWGTYRVAIRNLISVTSVELKGIKTRELVLPEEEIQVEIKKKSPLKSYIRKDLIIASRDFQTLMFLIMPILIPFIMIFSISSPIGEDISSPTGIMIAWSMALTFCIIIPSLLISGLLNMEESGASTIASLPVIPRDQAKAKLILMSVIQFISFTVHSITLTIIANSILLLVLFLATIPIVWIFLFLMFEMKMRLFGKMKYRYVIEELNKEHKVGKWILMLLVQIGLYFIVAILSFTSFNIFSIEGTALVLFIIGIIGFMSLVFVFTKMFPKVENMPSYRTGGALKENPILGIVVLLILYLGFGFLVGFLELLLLIPIISNLTLNGLLFIDFIFNFGFLAILWLFVVPFGLKLPIINKSFKQYTETIHLSTIRPVKRNILVGIVSFIIFGGIILCGAILLGNYIFDPAILFGNPGQNMAGFSILGWFLFIFMLIPGIWEEVSFRGVMIPMLLKKYTTRTAIIINGIAFGLFHGTNLILITIIGADPLFVFYQMVYATFIGFALAYMYIKTESLLPCIITHYLLDSVGQIFLNVQINDPVLWGVFLIGFLGIIPTALIILFVKYVIKYERKRIKKS